MELFVRFLVAMAVVFGGIALLGGLLRRRMGPLSLGARRATGAVGVVQRQQLGKGVSLVVVRAGEKDLLIGVTPHSVNLVAEIERAESGVEEEALEQGAVGGQWTAPLWRGQRPAIAWMAMLEQLRERTVRRA